MSKNYMSKYSPGVIVIIPFPFTDLSLNKIRPAVIVSREDESNSDITVAFISSYQGGRTRESQIVVRETDNSFQEMGLKVSSVIRCDKLATLDKKICLGRLGNCSVELYKRIRKALRYQFALS